MPHKYGWKPSPPDQRDFFYSAPRAVLASLPASVDLRPQFPVPAYDQGQLGSCGPNASGGDIEFSEYEQKVAAPTVPSRLFIYYNTRLLMGTVNQDSGVDNRTLMKAISQYGWCDEALWPYDVNQYTTKPSDSAYQQAAARAGAEYLRVNQDLDSMRACLASGDPFVFGFTVYESFESAYTNQTGVVTLPNKRERVLGGHDILFMGYDDAQQMFLFRNSWGGDWGQQGYGLFPYTYALNASLASDFWTVRHLTGVGPSPTPVPVPGKAAKVQVLDGAGSVLQSWDVKS